MELERIGLAAPQVTYVMYRLAQEGYSVDKDATTVQDAVKEILAALNDGGKGVGDR